MVKQNIVLKVFTEYVSKWENKLTMKELKGILDR